MIRKSSFSDTALGVCYLLSAAIMFAVYREELTEAAHAIRDSLPRSRFVSIRSLRGRVWRDVRDAVEHAADDTVTE